MVPVDSRESAAGSRWSESGRRGRVSRCGHGSDLASSFAPIRDFITPQSTWLSSRLSHNPTTLSGTMALTLAPELHAAVIDSSARTPPAPPKGSYSPKDALDDLPGTHYALELFLASKMVESEEYCDQCDPKKCVPPQYHVSRVAHGTRQGAPILCDRVRAHTDREGDDVL